MSDLLPLPPAGEGWGEGMSAEGANAVAVRLGFLGTFPEATSAKVKGFRLWRVHFF